MGCVIKYYITNVFVAKLGMYVRSYASIVKPKRVSHKLACEQWTDLWTGSWTGDSQSQLSIYPFYQIM